MRFSLAIAIALLLGSYAVGAPASSPEEGELSDDGSPHNGNTPASHHSGNTGNSGGSSSNPSIGLGLNRDHRGEIGTTELGNYASVSFSFKLT